MLQTSYLLQLLSFQAADHVEAGLIGAEVLKKAADCLKKHDAALKMADHRVK